MALLYNANGCRPFNARLAQTVTERQFISGLLATGGPGLQGADLLANSQFIGPFSILSHLLCAGNGSDRPRPRSPWPCICPFPVCTGSVFQSVGVGQHCTLGPKLASFVTSIGWPGARKALPRGRQSGGREKLQARLWTR